jgi:AAA family ATPase
VYLSKEAIFDLRLEAGQPCFLWRAGEDEGQKREAIAWPTSEKSLGKKAAQMTRTFQEMCGFKLSDDLKISAAGPLQMLETIVLRDVTALDSLSELTVEDKLVWDWPVRESLCKSKSLFFDHYILRFELVNRSQEQDHEACCSDGSAFGLY